MSETTTNISQKWDVIIIGTGMGGSTAGYTLAQKGLSVLFLEKGGDIKEKNELAAPIDPQERIEKGWWPNPISRQKSKKEYEHIYAAIGCGMGGSTMHYAAALERLDPIDFEELTTRNQTTEPWPVSYDNFCAYYEKAEKLFGLKEDNDEKWDARISEWDKAFIKNLKNHGMNPARLQVGMKYDKACTECVGVICHRKCKADARTICLEPALQMPNSHLLTHCEVERIESNQHHATGVQAKINGQTISLSATKIILAAGAIHTPQLLLKSKNEYWPNGLANSSGQVGRNLMFHGLDMYAIWGPKKIKNEAIQKKSVSIRELHSKNKLRLGHIQNMGIRAGRGVIAQQLKSMLRNIGITHEKLLSLITLIPSHIAAKALGEANIFAVQIEDDPDPDNRVILNPDEPDGASFNYILTDDIKKRAKEMHKQFKAKLGKWRIIRILPSLTFNSGHVCGTCRFGNNPSKNVLNKDCRTHDIKNLYVADSSFMPRSGAANPSLTIAANAIRVADIIGQSFDQQRSK